MSTSTNQYQHSISWKVDGYQQKSNITNSNIKSHQNQRRSTNITKYQQRSKLELPKKKRIPTRINTYLSKYFTKNSTNVNKYQQISTNTNIQFHQNSTKIGNYQHILTNRNKYQKQIPPKKQRISKNINKYKHIPTLNFTRNQ